MGDEGKHVIVQAPLKVSDDDGISWKPHQKPIKKLHDEYKNGKRTIWHKVKLERIEKKTPEQIQIFIKQNRQRFESLADGDLKKDLASFPVPTGRLNLDGKIVLLR